MKYWEAGNIKAHEKQNKEIHSYAKEMFKKREATSNKGSYGRATIFASCDTFVGAVKLSALGELSMRMGTGYSILAVPKEIVSSIAPNIFECVVSPQESVDGKFCFNEKCVCDAISKSSSVAVGMGMGKSEETRKLIEYLFDNFGGNLIIDADGINSITTETLQRKRKCNLLLTPHLKEFHRLSGTPMHDLSVNKNTIASNFAKKYNLTLLLKDYQSVITDGENQFEITSGSPSLAKAGSGDFLAGAISGLSANFDILQSAVVSADIIGCASSMFSEEYNDNIMLSRDLFLMVKSYISNLYE